MNLMILKRAQKKYIKMYKIGNSKALDIQLNMIRHSKKILTIKITQKIFNFLTLKDKSLKDYLNLI